MSGHSKWATIHRQKETKDAKRGQLFTKLAKAITVAVVEGGGVSDPERNFKLRLAVEKAHLMDMPKDNIRRAIQKAVGGEEEGKLELVTYEGYGPFGIAIMIETSTDNKNRTSQEIKNILEKNGGSLAGPGSVSFQFDKTGLILVEKPQEVEEAILKMIDFGVQDVEEARDVVEVYTQALKLEEIKKKLEALGFQIRSFELVMRAKSLIRIETEDKAVKILNLMERLGEQVDVDRIFANFDIPDEILTKLK